MARILKIILYVLGGIVVLAIVAAPIFMSYKRTSMTKDTFTQFYEGEELSFSPMKWVSSKIGESRVEKTAFFVPVKIKGLKGSLYMQFDSGATETSIYGKTLCQVLDPSNPISKSYDKDSVQYVENIKMKIGAIEMEASRIEINAKMGGLNKDTSFIIIGTIGFDSFYDRTLILDFKNDRITITQKTAEELDYDLTYVKKASVKKFPMILPANLGRKKIGLFYDTGSSMFSLITSNKRLEIINETHADTLCCISAWGENYPVHRKQLEVPISIGNYKFENQDVYGCETMDMMNYAPKRIMYGITGNRMFDKTIVVIDRKENLFGIEE